MPADTESGLPERQKRFMTALPWFVNGTLPVVEQAWVEHFIASEDWAKLAYAQEARLAAEVRSAVAQAPETGLQDLLDRVNAQAATLHESDATHRLLPVGVLMDCFRFIARTLAGPKIAGAMAMVVVIQTALLGSIAVRDQDEPGLVRSYADSQSKLIRVRAWPGVSEEAFRQALRSAGVAIREGPDQLGDYLVAPGGTMSRAETLDSLRAAAIFAKIDLVQ